MSTEEKLGGGLYFLLCRSKRLRTTFQAWFKNKRYWIAYSAFLAFPDKA
jgi:hypothetical protein